MRKKSKCQKHRDQIVEMIEQDMGLIEMSQRLEIPKSTLYEYMRSISDKEIKNGDFDPFKVKIIDFDMYAYRMGKEPLVQGSYSQSVVMVEDRISVNKHRW